jgi:hypothetical protein
MEWEIHRTGLVMVEKGKISVLARDQTLNTQFIGSHFDELSRFICAKLL